MIDGLSNSTAIPVLERLMQFTGQRHRILTNNIANLSTPGFRPSDVSVEDFQAQLGKAVEGTRGSAENVQSIGQPTAISTQTKANAFNLQSTSEVKVHRTGLTLNPTPTGDNILFHDGNDRDVERTMQSLVENFMTYRAAAQLLKNRYDILNTAIRERV